MYLGSFFFPSGAEVSAAHMEYMAVAVAVAVAVSVGGSVAVAGLTKRFSNHLQKDVLINVWVY